MTTALIRQLETTRDETVGFFELAGEDLARTYAPGKWSVRFILHHLADSETVFVDRIHRILSESRPVIWAMDQDAWASSLGYDTLPLEISCRTFEAVRNSVIHYARECYDQKGHLEFVHSVTGVRTLKDEFDKVAAHNENHLRQIRQALSS